MKRCPQCRRDYFDASLLYCLDDGSRLLDGPAFVDEAATAILPRHEAAGEAPTRDQIDKPNETAMLNVASRKNSFIAGIIGLLLVTTLAVGGYLYYERSSAKQIASIAVMPFVNASGNPDIEYLSDGMTETLIRTLSQLSDLNVKARSSVFRYKGKATDVQTIGKELNVQGILTGRVVQRGEELSLNLELVDVLTENVIWTDRYDRRSTDLVSLQNEVARDVTNKLRTKLSGTELDRLEKRSTENTGAYQLYLRGRFEWNKRQKDSLLRAVENFRQAIQIDPNFALAYSALADCYIVFSTYEVAPPAEAYALARAAVQKSLEIDDTHGEAYAALASINDDYDWDFGVAERNYLKAIELSPNYATARQGYAEYLRMVGRFDESIAQASRAVELDPVSVSVNRGLGESLCLAGKVDDAISQFHRTIELDPGFPGTYRDFAECYAMKGLYDDAVTESRKAVERSSGGNSSLGSLAYILAMGEGRAEARQILEQLDKRRESQYVDGTHLAPAYYALGEMNTAFIELTRAYNDRSPGIRYIRVDPRYGNNFRSDPRYVELVRKIGLP